MDLTILRKIGLSKGEVKVYTALLQKGRSPLQTVHEAVGIERRNLYDILNKLIGRGLVSYVTENKKRYFQPTHPNAILGYLAGKEHELSLTKNQIKKQLPAMTDLFTQKKSAVHAEVYRGKNGLKTVWEDLLNYKKHYFIGGGGYVADHLPFYWSHYKKRREKRGIVWYNLWRHEFRSRKHPVMTIKAHHIRFLPPEFSANPMVVFIYGNKVANVLWGEEFFAFVIENKEIAENYRRYFQYLWEKVATDKRKKSK